MLVTFPSTVGLDFEWEYPGPLHIEMELVRIEQALEHTEVFMEQAKERLQQEMEQRFETETDPDGIPWTPQVQPNNPFEHKILQLSGDLREDATSDRAWIATPVGVFFDTSALPDYWVYHEQPEGAGAQRISQRRFIGRTEDADAELELIGDEWVAGIVLGKRGFISEGRNAIGRFEKIT